MVNKDKTTSSLLARNISEYPIFESGKISDFLGRIGSELANQKKGRRDSEKNRGGL